MRQVVIPRFGAPDVLEVRQVPDPLPGAGDLRIHIRAAGINFADILARLGLYPDAPKPPMVVGYEVSGTVWAAAAAATRTNARTYRAIGATRLIDSLLKASPNPFFWRECGRILHRLVTPSSVGESFGFRSNGHRSSGFLFVQHCWFNIAA